METTPQYGSDAEIAHLVLQFQGLDLPLKRWTHQAHLAVAMWHLQRYSREETLCLLRSGIITYNAACGGKNTTTGGYHETLTLFWVGQIDHFLENAGRSRRLESLFAKFVSLPEADPKSPFKHYSRERLFSVQARALWVQPDLEELEWSWGD